MRVIAGALMVAAILSARSAHADEGRGNIVFFNPFTLIVRTVTVGVEHQTAPRASLVVGATYTDDFEVNNLNGQDFIVNGWGAYLQPHLYVGRHDAPRGPYLAPFASLTRSRIDWETSSDETVTTFGAGATVGWSWMIGRRLNFKL